MASTLWTVEQYLKAVGVGCAVGSGMLILMLVFPLLLVVIPITLAISLLFILAFGLVTISFLFRWYLSFYVSDDLPVESWLSACRRLIGRGRLQENRKAENNDPSLRNHIEAKSPLRPFNDTMVTALCILMSVLVIAVFVTQVYVPVRLYFIGHIVETVVLKEDYRPGYFEPGVAAVPPRSFLTVKGLPGEFSSGSRVGEGEKVVILYDGGLRKGVVARPGMGIIELVTSSMDPTGIGTVWAVLFLVLAAFMAAARFVALLVGGCIVSWQTAQRVVQEWRPTIDGIIVTVDGLIEIGLASVGSVLGVVCWSLLWMCVLRVESAPEVILGCALLIVGTVFILPLPELFVRGLLGTHRAKHIPAWFVLVGKLLALVVIGRLLYGLVEVIFVPGPHTWDSLSTLAEGLLDVWTQE